MTKEPTDLEQTLVEGRRERGKGKKMNEECDFNKSKQGELEEVPLIRKSKCNIVEASKGEEEVSMTATIERYKEMEAVG